MTRGLCCFTVVALTAVVSAQMTTAERYAAVSEFAQAIGLSESFADGMLRPSNAKVQGQSLSPRFSLWKGERRFEISDDLTLRSFVDMSDEAYTPRTLSTEKFQTDSDAWDALDTLLARLDAPQSLIRHSAVRLHGESEPAPIIRLMMREKPHGYVAQGGNTVLAEFHRQTGRVLRLTISTGWSYEPPNIRVTSSQAADLAISLQGGVRSEWSSVLEYWTTSDPNAPVGIRELKALRRMRLCNNVFGARGSVLIDSVTGEVVFNTSRLATLEDDQVPNPSSVAPPKPAPSPKSVQGESHVNLLDSSGNHSATGVIGYSLGAAAVAVGGVWWLKQRRM